MSKNIFPNYYSKGNKYTTEKVIFERKIKYIIKKSIEKKNNTLNIHKIEC